MEDAPLFKITRGTPTAEELAALVGIVIAGCRSNPTPPSPAASAWSRSARPGALAATRPRPGAWRESELPC